MSNKYVGQEITDDIAADFAIYAMLSSNCYHNSDREYFKVELLGWNNWGQCKVEPFVNLL
jgi:hypothetical protein